MWTGIIAIVAFYAGFLVASLLACAKAADTKMEMIRKTSSYRNDHLQEYCVGTTRVGKHQRDHRREFALR